MTGDELAELIAEAKRPRSCSLCGLTFASQAAWQVGHDGRCLPPGAYGQTVEIDGVWVQRGTEQQHV